MDPQNNQQYGHVHWRSTLTGAKGAGGGVHLQNPEEVIDRLNRQLPAITYQIIYHWVPFGPKSNEP
jgi:hypothetical protein